MGVETELLGLKNRYDGKEFRIVEREDGTIAVLAGDKVLVDSGVTPVTAVPSDQGIELPLFGKTQFPVLAQNGIADDAAALNAALTSNPGSIDSPITIKLRPGTVVKLSSPVIIGSHQTVDLSGVKVIHGAGVPVFTNRARVDAPLRTFNDVVLVVGQAYVDSASAAFTPADVGKSFYCTTGSASPENTHFTAKITSIASATRANLEWAPGAAVTGGIGRIYSRDQNIKIIGDSRTQIVRDIASSTNDNNEQSTILTRVDGLQISGIKYTSSQAKYGFLLSDIRNFTVRDMGLYSHSDGVHITGPAINGLIENIIGATEDDFVALGCMDYPTYCETQGPLRNIEVRRLTAEGGKGFHLFGGAKDAAISAKTITIDGVYGNFTAAPVNVEAGYGDSLTVVDDIIVRNVRPTKTNNFAHVVVGSSTGQNMGTVRVHGLYDDGAAGAGTVGNVVALANVDCLEVSGVERTAASNASCVVNVANASTTVKQLKLSGLRAKFGASNADIVSIAGQVKALVFDGADIEGHSGVKLTNCGTQTALAIHAANISCSGFTGAYLWWLSGVVDISFSNCSFGTCYMAVRAVNSGSVVTVRGSGVTWTPTIAMEGAVGTSIHPRSLALYGEADRPNISKAVGNAMYNTKAGLSCGVGYVVADGTAYKNIYSGATF